MDSPTVLLMLKAPRVGGVKTRLAAEIGFEAATAAYRALVEHQLQEVPSGWRAHIYYAPADAGEEMRAWLGAEHLYSAQTEGNLGPRLAQAVEDHFRRDGSALLVVGGDCPYLHAKLLREAANGLHTHEAVIVPAADGGYCLIGLRADAPLFHGITWSTASVLAETRTRLLEAGLAWLELEPQEDVDDAPSWQRALERVPSLAAHIG